MQITLDQARALDALAREGTLVRAAQALHKVHTAVLYALRQLEAQAALPLLDRRGYRLKLTPAGERVLDHARRLLDAERALVSAVAEMRTGWEPSLRVVFDGIYPAGPILGVVAGLVAEAVPTRVSISAEFLGGVEAAFARDEADLMIAVLPPEDRALVTHRLPELRARLVAHRDHPLARARKPLTLHDLEAHVLLTVRGGDPRLALPTARLEHRGSIQLNDFHAKTAAIAAGIGYGWLPDHLWEAEGKKGGLRVLRTEWTNESVFAPRLCHRAGVTLGRAAQRMVEALGARMRAQASAARARGSRGRATLAPR